MLRRDGTMRKMIEKANSSSKNDKNEQIKKDLLTKVPVGNHGLNEKLQKRKSRNHSDPDALAAFSAPKINPGVKHSEIVDKEFISGSNYKVHLTPTQRNHYTLVFQLNDVDRSGSIEISELSFFMTSLGHAITEEELATMMHELGVDQDGDGEVDVEEFLEFIR